MPSPSLRAQWVQFLQHWLPRQSHLPLIPPSPLPTVTPQIPHPPPSPPKSTPPPSPLKGDFDCKKLSRTNVLIGKASKGRRGMTNIVADHRLLCVSCQPKGPTRQQEPCSSQRNGERVQTGNKTCSCPCRTAVLCRWRTYLLALLQ